MSYGRDCEEHCEAPFLPKTFFARQHCEVFFDGSTATCCVTCSSSVDTVTDLLCDRKARPSQPNSEII